jgi:hypothetical protein
VSTAPAPRPSAIGSVPTSAAIVVIMIDGSARGIMYRLGRPAPFALDGEVHHHDAVLSRADQHDDADNLQAQLGLEDEQCEQRRILPTAGLRESSAMREAS